MIFLYIMKIVFLDADTLGSDVNFREIEQYGSLIMYPYTNKPDIIERVKDAEVIIVNKVVIGREEIDNLPSLKLICVAATGVNNIDVEYAAEKGVVVKNAVGYSTESVVQVTFGSLLSLINSCEYFDNTVKSGRYSAGDSFTDTGRTFFELSGKCFGIIGMGTIGRRVAEVATAFGAKVCYYSTNGVAHNSDYASVSLEELMCGCDIISVHAPLNDKTRNLISLKELKMAKQGAIVVNMGRGGIINEADLAEALDNGIIAGAVIDVFSKEPVPADHPFMKIGCKDRIIMTPHIGWASIEARERLITIIAENIGKWAASSKV